ncbi:MAG: LuxR family transcriptional regulator [Rhodobacterales bacterium]|nr:LuxR family transcriptional regulator [Rhodobacterales bacterium]
MSDPASASIEEHLAQTIGKIGRAGFEDSLWGLLVALARPDNMVALVYRDWGAALELCRMDSASRAFARLQSTYLEGVYRLSPFYGLHLQRAEEGLYRLRDIAPDAFQRSRFYVEYFGQTTIIDEVAFTVRLGEGLSLNLFLGRDGQSGKAFLPGEIMACRRMAPVIAALARAHWPAPRVAPGPAEDLPALLASAADRVLGIGLSPRQAQVAVLILKGHSTLSIGLNLGLSPQTVKVFRKQLYARCRISSQAELFALMLPLLNGS